MLNPDLIERIRTIFLHDQPYVSIAEAMALLGWSRNEMTEAIRTREIEPIYTCSGKAIRREDVAAKALELWPVETIEEALGPKAKSTLPEAIRTRELRTRLPRYQLAMLQYIAEREQTTIGRVLARELDCGNHGADRARVSPLPCNSSDRVDDVGAVLVHREALLRLGVQARPCVDRSVRTHRGSAA